MKGNNSHSNAFLKQLIELVESNLNNEHYDVEKLSQDICLSRSQLYKRLQSETGQSISQFIREIRLQRAHEMLLDGTGTAAEIAYDVGFSSPTYFNKCFHDFYGYTPGKLIKQRKIKGKFVPVDNVKSTTSFTSKVIWLSAVSMALIALGVWHLKLSNRSLLLAEESREARVAIIPFTNNTNDPDLDMLGGMAADWITRGLMNFEDIEVVSYRAIRDNIEFAALKDPEKRAAFIERTDANKAITGNYYLANSEIIFHAQLLDIATNEVELVLPVVRGEKIKIEALINDINQRVMSIFGIDLENDSLLILRYPPYFSAYQSYLKSLDFLWSDFDQSTKYLKEAIRLDSTFLPPYLTLADEYETYARIKEKDSLLMVIKERFKVLTPLEQAQLNIHEAKTLTERYDAMKVYLAKDPKNYFTNYWLPGWAGAINKPFESLALREYCEQQNISFPNKKLEWYWRWTHYLNLTRLGRFDEVITEIESLPVMERMKYLNTFVFNYIMTEQPEKVYSIISQMENTGVSGNQINQTYMYTSNCYKYKGDSAEQYSWAQKGLDKIIVSSKEGNTNNWLLSWAYFNSWDFENALIIYEDMLNKNRNYSVLQMAGLCYAEIGMLEEAQMVIAKLDTVQNDLWSEEKYFIARIYTTLNEKEKAVDYLHKAFDGNYGFGNNRYDLDPFLRPLSGYPPYEEFIKPKG